jgi:hypothetical protein
MSNDGDTAGVREHPHAAARVGARPRCSGSLAAWAIRGLTPPIRERVDRHRRSELDMAARRPID